MGKFRLQPEPTFRRAVRVPVPGGGFEPIEFTFKYRDRKDLLTFAQKHTPALPEEGAPAPGVEQRIEEDAALILEMASGWDLSDAFTTESVEQLVTNYPTSAVLIFEAYLGEHSKVREKN